MKLTKNIGMLLLGIWLILTGVFAVFNIQIEGKDTIMAILAIASGAFLLLGK